MPVVAPPLRIRANANPDLSFWDYLPSQLLFADHFSGSALNAAIWTRSTTGTAPTASFPAGFQGGVYRETTAAAASTVLLRAGVGAFPESLPVFQGAFGFGAAGPSVVNILSRFGWANDPTTLSANYAIFRVNPTGTVDIAIRAAGAEQSVQIAASLTALFGAGNENKIHEFRIEVTPTVVNFYVGTQLVGALAAQLPAVGTRLEAFIAHANSGGTVAQSLDVDYAFATAVISYVP